MRRFIRPASLFGPPPEEACWEHVLVMFVATTMALLALLVVAGVAGLLLAPVVLCVGLVDGAHRLASALERRHPLRPH